MDNGDVVVPPPTLIKCEKCFKFARDPVVKCAIIGCEKTIGSCCSAFNQILLHTCKVHQDGSFFQSIKTLPTLSYSVSRYTNALATALFKKKSLLEEFDFFIVKLFEDYFEGQVCFDGLNWEVVASLEDLVQKRDDTKSDEEESECNVEIGNFLVESFFFTEPKFGGMNLSDVNRNWVCKLGEFALQKERVQYSIDKIKLSLECRERKIKGVLVDLERSFD